MAVAIRWPAHSGRVTPPTSVPDRSVAAFQVMGHARPVPSVRSIPSRCARVCVCVRRAVVGAWRKSQRGGILDYGGSGSEQGHGRSGGTYRLTNHHTATHTLRHRHHAQLEARQERRRRRRRRPRAAAAGAGGGAAGGAGRLASGVYDGLVARRGDPRHRQHRPEIRQSVADAWGRGVSARRLVQF